MIPSNIRGKTFKGNVNCVNRDGAMMLRNGTGTMKSILCSLSKESLSKRNRIFHVPISGPIMCFFKTQKIVSWIRKVYNINKTNFLHKGLCIKCSVEYIFGFSGSPYLHLSVNKNKEIRIFIHFNTTHTPSTCIFMNIYDLIRSCIINHSSYSASSFHNHFKEVLKFYW